MNFDFVEQLRLYLENSDVFGWSFLMSGCKAMAIALLMFKLLNTYISDFDNETPKLGNVFNVIGYACVIMSSDWIIGFIETIFANIDSQMYGTPSDLYVELESAISLHKDEIIADLGFMDFFSLPVDIIGSIFYSSILGFLVSLFKIADLAITAGYLLSRLFLLQLMKLFFPLVIALSTLDITKDLLGKWIKRYVGLFILGLAYIGIINFCSILQAALLLQFKTSEAGGIMDMGNFIGGAIITVVVVFTFKVKMFNTATSYVTNFFS